jgi:hypothetical protein
MKKVVIVVVVIAAAGAAGWWFFSPRSVAPAAGGESHIPYTVPALTTPYQNDTYHFSLKLPDGFSAREITSADGGNTLVFEDTKGNGIQVVVAPFDEDTGQGYTLTRERILQDVPDIVITEPQPVEVGASYTGLAFTSDNEAFDGASREVWFVFRGNLYQISTYERLDPLLKAIFATWNFF